MVQDPNSKDKHNSDHSVEHRAGPGKVGSRELRQVAWFPLKDTILRIHVFTFPLEETLGSFCILHCKSDSSSQKLRSFR